MGFMVFNLPVLWLTGNNQFLEWEIMGEYSQTFEFVLDIRYVRPTPFVVYWFGLLVSQRFPLHEECFFSSWFTFETMAPVVRKNRMALRIYLPATT
jgi:hypothetical protein